jgi:hypothetical protein
VIAAAPHFMNLFPAAIRYGHDVVSFDSWLTAAGVSCFAAELRANEIMERVAAKLDKAVALCGRVSFTGSILSSRRAISMVNWRSEEKTDFDVAPGAKSDEKKLALITGRSRRAGRSWCCSYFLCSLRSATACAALSASSAFTFMSGATPVPSQSAVAKGLMVFVSGIPIPK